MCTLLRGDRARVGRLRCSRCAQERGSARVVGASAARKTSYPPISRPREVVPPLNTIDVAFHHMLITPLAQHGNLMHGHTACSNGLGPFTLLDNALFMISTLYVAHCQAEMHVDPHATVWKSNKSNKSAENKHMHAICIRNLSHCLKAQV